MSKRSIRRRRLAIEKTKQEKLKLAEQSKAVKEAQHKAEIAKKNAEAAANRKRKDVAEKKKKATKTKSSFNKAAE